MIHVASQSEPTDNQYRVGGVWSLELIAETHLALMTASAFSPISRSTHRVVLPDRVWGRLPGRRCTSPSSCLMPSILRSFDEPVGAHDAHIPRFRVRATPASFRPPERPAPSCAILDLMTSARGNRSGG